MIQFVLLNVPNVRRSGKTRQDILAIHNNKIVGRLRSSNGFLPQQILDFVQKDFSTKRFNKEENIPIWLL